MKRLKPWKNFRRKERGAVMFTELLLISAMVGLGTLAGAKLLADFNGELSDLGAAARSADASCPSSAGASCEPGGVSIAGTPGFALGSVDDPQGTRSRPAVGRATQDMGR